MEDEKKDTKAKICNLLKDSVEKKSPKQSSVEINGDSNIVGDNNTILNTNKVIHNIKAEVTPGDEHITDKQAGTLLALVHDIVDLEKILKKRPRTHQAVWLFLNRKIGVPRYRLIPYDKFPEAEKILRKEIGRLNSMRSAPTKNPDWRNSKYRFIHANCKKYNLYERMREYILKNHGVESTKDLTDDQLELTYQAVASWRGKDNPKQATN